MSQTPDYVIVIPARFASERLPGKMLLEVSGRSLLEHTWRRALDSAAGQVVIATDNNQIHSVATAFGAEVVMTASSHRSGSDRIAECARIQGWKEDQVIVNLQGDEPLMPAECLDQVASLLGAHPDTDVATLYALVASAAEVNNPNVVKVVARHDGHALLFSRSGIPVARDFNDVAEAMSSGIKWRRHLGLYAYRRRALDWFAKTPATPLEMAEKLEQLRFLECGRRIVLARARMDIPPGVDTQADLDRVRDIISE